MNDKEIEALLQKLRALRLWHWRERRAFYFLDERLTFWEGMR